MYRGQSHFVEFQTKSGEFVTVCKTLLLTSPRENVSVEEVIDRLPALFRAGQKWAIFMCSGGHFAGVCFDGAKVVAHKTIHKYTTRRKQGGSQAAQDSTGKKAKSAGASIRRYNEQALQQEIRALLAEWGPHIRQSAYLFIQAATFNRQIFIGYDETPFQRGDDRLRKIPFTTRRPTFAEVKRLHTLLSSVTFSFESMYKGEAEAVARERESQLERQQQQQRQKKEKAKKAKEKAAEGEKAAGTPVPTLTKEQDLVMQACKKGKVDLLASVLAKNLEAVLDFVDERGWAPLHVAANEGFDAVVALLLERGANPSVMVKGVKNKTPYNFSKNLEVRNAFRRMMAREPARWDYAAAQIPSPLTEEMEKAEEEKKVQRATQVEKERKKREKKKAHKAKAAAGSEGSDDQEGDIDGHEHASSAARTSQSKSSGSVVGSGSKKPTAPGVHVLREQGTPRIKQGPEELERERRARAAEQRLGSQQAASGVVPTGPRCTFCERSLQGLVPFERLEFKYCSTKCVAEHRKVINR